MRTAILTPRTITGLVVAAALFCACPPPGPQHPVNVTFRVSVPLSTPTTASLRIVGDAPALGNGSGSGLALDKVADGLFTGKAALEAESTVHFQIIQEKPAALELKDDYTAPDRSFTVGAQGQPQTVTLGVARWVPPLGEGEVAVRFEVTAGPTTPAGAALYLTGNVPALGSWQPNGLPLALLPSGLYVGRAVLAPGTTVQFKVTRGSWYTLERGASAEDIPNRTYAVPAGGGTAQLTTATWQDLDPRAVLTGDIRYERAFHSVILNNDRDIIIHLPAGYADDGTRRYPVLYMQDGQNLMDPATSFSGEWGVDETAQRLERTGQMTPVIIVGVANTGDRIAEYTEVSDPRYGGGKADDYGRFLVEELKPVIDQKYRTQPNATGIAGSSLGGLVSLYLGLTRPTVFTKVGAVSASIWWSSKDITTRYQALTAKPPLRIWEDIGTNEGGTPQEEVDNARQFRDVLVSKGWTLGGDLAYLEVPGAEHNEAAWAARLDRILAYLYPPAP